MNRKILAPLLAVALLAVTVLPAPPAAGQFAVIDVANLAPNFQTAIQTYVAIAQRIAQILNQVRQVQAALQNLQRLADPKLRDIGWLFYDLSYLLRETEGLVYSLDDLDRQVRETFPGYQPVEDYVESYSARTHTTLETLRAALLSTQRVARTLGPTQGTLSELTRQALDAQGNLEALEANSALVGHTAQEISLLIQQVAVLTNAQTVYFSHVLETEAEAAATYEGWIDDARRAPDPYDGVHPFPLIPAGYPW